MAAPSQGPQFLWIDQRSPQVDWWPAEPVNESPPSTREDGPPGLEQTDGSMSRTGANESISTDAALLAGLTSPLARDQGPRRSERHQNDTDTYLKEKYPDSQL